MADWRRPPGERPKPEAAPMRRPAWAGGLLFEDAGRSRRRHEAFVPSRVLTRAPLWRMLTVLRARKVKLKVFLRTAFEGASPSSPWDSQAPIREELFSVERLEDHARSLAVAQIVSSRTTKGQLLAKRLVANRAVLLAAYRSAVKAINDGRAITPAAEWLVDNYHLVEKQIHEIRSDLPPGYYRQLPKLAVGPFVGYPRVFGIAWAFVAHTDSRFDAGDAGPLRSKPIKRCSRLPSANSGRCRSRSGSF